MTQCGHPIIIKKKFSLEAEPIQEKLKFEIDPLISEGKGKENMKFKKDPILSVVPNEPFQNKLMEEQFKKSPYYKCDIFVVLIEGVHGIGKTTIIKQLSLAGFNVLNEHFLNTFANFILPPTNKNRVDHNCAVEFAWAGQQMINIVNLAINMRRRMYRRRCLDKPRKPYDDVIFVDRCYLTGAAYGHFSKSFDDFLDIFRAAFAQMEETHNIHPIYCYLKPAKIMDVYTHIAKRIDYKQSFIKEDEAEKRTVLKERDYEFLVDKHKIYEKFCKDQFFDLIVYQDYDETTIYKIIKAYKQFRYLYYKKIAENLTTINPDDYDPSLDDEDSIEIFESTDE